MMTAWIAFFLITLVGRIDCLGGLSKTVRSFASASTNDFAIDLLKTLPVGRHNQFFSPFSISTAFAMMSLGAKANTLEEIKNTFHFKALEATFPDSMALHKIYQNMLATYGNRNSSFSLEFANGMFVKNGYEILQNFVRRSSNYYSATVNRTNFNSGKAEQEINEWVARKTHQKIKKIFPSRSLSRSTVLALINVIYFRGQWVNEFNGDRTQSLPFHVSRYFSKNVDMMSQMGTFMYAEDKKLDVKVIKMPYIGEDLSMVVIIPEIGKLEHLLNNLNATVLQELFSNMKFKSVKLRFPKLKMKGTYELTAQLKALRLSSVFSRRADLSGISTKSLQLSSVNHKAFIEIDEKGSEAAAATVLAMRPLSTFAVKTTEVDVDRPFFFAIIDKRFEDLMLFVGTVACP